MVKRLKIDEGFNYDGSRFDKNLFDGNDEAILPDLELLNALMDTINCIYNSTNERDKEYFRKEFWRLKDMFDKDLKSWINVL